jgi:hypothetical protein
MEEVAISLRQAVVLLHQRAVQIQRERSRGMRMGMAMLVLNVRIIFMADFMRMAVDLYATASESTAAFFAHKIFSVAAEVSPLQSCQHR